MAVSLALSEALWLRSLLIELDISNDPVIIYEDNQSTIRVAHNPELHKRLKHIDIRHHYHYHKLCFVLQCVSNQHCTLLITASVKYTYKIIL